MCTHRKLLTALAQHQEQHNWGCTWYSLFGIFFSFYIRIRSLQRQSTKLRQSTQVTVHCSPNLSLPSCTHFRHNILSVEFVNQQIQHSQRSSTGTVSSNDYHHILRFIAVFFSLYIWLDFRGYTFVQKPHISTLFYSFSIPWVIYLPEKCTWVFCQLKKCANK